MPEKKKEIPNNGGMGDNYFQLGPHAKGGLTSAVQIVKDTGAPVDQVKRWSEL